MRTRTRSREAWGTVDRSDAMVRNARAKKKIRAVQKAGDISYCAARRQRETQREFDTAVRWPIADVSASGIAEPAVAEDREAPPPTIEESSLGAPGPSQLV